MDKYSSSLTSSAFKILAFQRVNVSKDGKEKKSHCIVAKYLSSLFALLKASALRNILLKNMIGF